jgi:hypothetical protein
MTILSEYAQRRGRYARRRCTSFSFTAKNLHDDAADSLAMMAGSIAEHPNVISVARRPF